MNITVCIKQVPGSTQVEIDEATGVLKRSGADAKMNPYDLYALETALRLRESRGGTVRVITMGPFSAEEVLREAFAMGADEAFLITDRRFSGADVLATAYTISQGIKLSGDFDLILCGKQTTDGDTAQVGPEVSEYLNIPGIANVTKILGCDENGLELMMDMQTLQEHAYVSFPCLISVDKNIFQPRLPSYRLKKASADKPIHRITLDELSDRDAAHYGLNGSATQVKRIFPPKTDHERRMFTGTAREQGEAIAARLKELKFI